MAWTVMWWLVWWSLGLFGLSAAPAPAPALRFHHLHYRSADPLSAMRRFAGAAGVQPSILQGLGVGVRIGDQAGPAEYVLFDRPPAQPVSPQEPIATTLPRVVGWLTSRGFAVSVDGIHIQALSDRLAPDTFDHIAFAASDFPDALERLRKSGARVATTTAESAFIDVGSAGLRVEIVRDPDQPDAFWCPMHPDVRSPAAGACPICRMALVPIPAPQAGEYRMDVDVLPARGGLGASGLRLTLGPPDSAARMPSLLTVHDRRLHLFVIGTDLNYFQHVHPDERSNGSFEWLQSVPPGEYMVIADFVPAGGTPQMVQRAVATRGYDVTKAASHATVALPPSTTALVEGLRGTLVAPALTAGQVATVRITLADERTHEPVTNLEPYLSAPAHALFASADLTHVTHVHPQDQDAFGPTLSFEILPAVDGAYKLWVQVQRGGRVLTLPFVLAVGK